MTGPSRSVHPLVQLLRWTLLLPESVELKVHSRRGLWYGHYREHWSRSSANIEERAAYTLAMLQTQFAGQQEMIISRHETKKHITVGVIFDGCSREDLARSVVAEFVMWTKAGDLDRLQARIFREVRKLLDSNLERFRTFLAMEPLSREAIQELVNVAPDIRRVDDAAVLEFDHA